MSSNILKRAVQICLFVLIGMLMIPDFSKAQSRQRYSMDLDWRFTRGDIENAEDPDFDDSDGRQLDVPHDWSIEGSFKEDYPTGGSGGYLPTGIGWYRKTFTVPKDMLDRKAWLQFDGIYMNSDVWINGHHLGHRPYGYVSFKYDIEKYLQEGENVIAVRVDDSKQPSSRWYSGTGIYRHVWMTVTNPLHIDHWGVYATTPVANEDHAVVDVQTEVSNEIKSDQEGTLSAVLVDENGNKVARADSNFVINADSQQMLEQKLNVQSPKLWSIDSPSLYKAVGKKDGEVVVTKEVETTGEATALRLSTDKDKLSANGRDVAHLKVELVDENGNVVPRANNRIDFEIKGEGEIIGIASGNPQDHTSHQENYRKAFNGMALAIIQSTRTTGGITVTAKVDGMESQSVEINTRETEDTFNYWRQ